MPKIKTKSGKIKHFPYSSKGRAAAKKAVKMGGKMMMNGKMKKLASQMGMKSGMM